MMQRIIKTIIGCAVLVLLGGQLSAGTSLAAGNSTGTSSTPTLSYSTYVGSYGKDTPTASAVDAAGNIYVTGWTTASNFPTTPGAYNSNVQNDVNSTQVGAFVAKFNPQGTSLIYSTYLHAPQLDRGTGSGIMAYGIAVDASGCVYVTGKTATPNFPATPGAYITSQDGLGVNNAFVIKLNQSGSAIVYATIIGASGGVSTGNSIAVNSTGNAYVTGTTEASNFPTTAGAFQTTGHAANTHPDGFVTKLNPQGTGLVFSTFIGGTDKDTPQRIKVGADNAVYITGTTSSTDFPTTQNALLPAFAGGARAAANSDAFFTKINAQGTGLIYSSYIGGNSDEIGTSLAILNSNNIWLAGSSYSSNFPTTPDAAYQPSNGKSGYLMHLDLTQAGRNSLVYSTSIQAQGGTEIVDIGLSPTDSTGNAGVWVAGNFTPGADYAKNFPVTSDALMSVEKGASDAYIVNFSAAGQITYATLYGGSNSEQATSIAVGSNGVYLTGTTDSTDFPVTSGAFARSISVNPSSCTTCGGSIPVDGFVVRLSNAPQASTGGFNFSSSNVTVEKSSGAIDLTVTRAGDTSGAATVDFTTSDATALQRTDYVLMTGTIAFKPGDTSKTITVPIVNNANGGTGGGDKTFNVSLFNARNGYIGAQPGETVTIHSSPSNVTNNPIDDASFFARQHYYDFLGRLPDDGGLNYWTGSITSCGTDAKCIAGRRVGVSAAFFIENEFQDTGSFVYRLYRASYGRVPQFNEFMPDRSRITAMSSPTGTNPGAAPDVIKTAFAEDWVTRPQFTSMYGTDSSANFISTLLVTIQQGSGVDLSDRRAEFFADFSAYHSRAHTIRLIVDDPTFKAVEYNRAFVLMQYFGYLRRDPDTNGYNFWLDILNNKVPNNFRSMVCAFITSKEYQFRFGQNASQTDAVCGNIN